MKKSSVTHLSDEQEVFLHKALLGENILVDACIGSGKTTAIQHLCRAFPETTQILYLTYNKLLKLDAKGKIKSKNVTVTNYHGFAFHMLRKVGVEPNIADAIQLFNDIKPQIKTYDVLIIDEYQDIEWEFSGNVGVHKIYESNNSNNCCWRYGTENIRQNDLRCVSFYGRVSWPAHKASFHKMFQTFR